ncbi:MAG: energy transducer TonB, partial [Candidatus Omnitrophica bacterium]|nr:energy transducer TonB [Candidatus Omnitrophota bacterium]
VDKAGYPQTVEIEKSSGHSTLDQSALKTVRTWRFSPARVGQMPVESMVHLPVRFDLDDI